MSSIRAVFYLTENQEKRMEKLDLPTKKVGSYASDAFEEWLKRREGRALRALLQKKKYADMLDE